MFDAHKTAICLESVKAESNRLGDALERMVEIEAERFPNWPQEDRLEMARISLFGRKRSEV